MSDPKKEIDQQSCNPLRVDLYNGSGTMDEEDIQEKSNLAFYKECQEIVNNSSYPEPKHQAFIDKYEEYLKFREDSANQHFRIDIEETRKSIMNKIQGGMQ